MFAIKFELDDDVVIACSGEIGTVVGRWESVNSAPRYLVRYRAADGRAVENWWDQDALVTVGGRSAECAPPILAPYQFPTVDPMAGVELAAPEGATQAPDPTAGGQVDRTVAAPAQDVGDGFPDF